ncbi:MAG: amino acid ABC transporter substrate-binding protein [Pseudomonadota bacterium]
MKISRLTPSRRFTKPLQLLACATVCSLGWGLGSTAQAADTLERIQARGHVVLGHRDASIPLSYVSEGKPVGYSLDVCHKVVDAVARHLKLKELPVRYLQVTSATRFAAIQQGEADFECGSTTNTAERREKVAFTIPHFIASARIIVRSNRPYERIEDLNTRTVASTLGTTNIDTLAREARIKTISIQVEPAKDHAEGVAWVLAGKVDGFAMDDVLLFGLRANAPKPEDLKVIGKPMTIEPYAVVFERNNPALKRLVDSELRRLITTKEINKLYDKWFLSPIPPRGINLKMAMPNLLSDSFRFPTDYVPN